MLCITNTLVFFADFFSYVLYPKLTCVRTVLGQLRYDENKKDIFQEELSNVLRRCLAPVALAIDAIHSPVPGRR